MEGYRGGYSYVILWEQNNFLITHLIYCIMKRCLFLAALAGMALTGCVKNEVLQPEAKDVKVLFESPVMYQNVDTKANYFGEIGSHSYDGTTSNYTYPRAEDFRIYAVKHNGNLTSWGAAEDCQFNDKAISYDGSLDAWAPKTSTGSYFYWPSGQLLSFAAVSPADFDLGDDVEPVYGAAGLEIENFVVQADPAKQYDLLFSKRAVNMSADDMLEGALYYSGIPIEFQHALSSIHFSIKKEQNVAEKVVLTKIELKNARNKGTFNENITNETVYASEPAWTVSEESADKASYVSFSGKVEFPLQQQYVSALAGADVDEEGENETSHALLLMPQTLGDDLEIHISYTVWANENTSTDFTKVVKINQYPKGNPITEWNIGTRYIYRLVYGTSSQKQDIIFFSPSTEGWIDQAAIEIIL